MGEARMFLDTEDAADVVAMIGRAYALLIDELGLTPEELRREITAEVEDVISTHRTYAAA